MKIFALYSYTSYREGFLGLGSKLGTGYEVGGHVTRVYWPSRRRIEHIRAYSDSSQCEL